MKVTRAVNESEEKGVSRLCSKHKHTLLPDRLSLAKPTPEDLRRGPVGVPSLEASQGFPGTVLSVAGLRDVVEDTGVRIGTPVRGILLFFTILIGLRQRSN